MVAEVEELIECEGVFANVVFADVDLEALAVLLELGEAGLALEADGHDAAGDGYLLAVGLELLARDGSFGGVVLALDVGDERGEGEAVGVGGLGVVEAVLLAEGGDLLELFLALLVELLLEFGVEVQGNSFG